jgi:cytochrome c peroxidase
MQIIFFFIFYALMCLHAVAQETLELSKELFDKYAASYQPDSDKNKKIDKNSIALGKKIFFDTRFSENSKMSCGTCHIPQKSFSDNNPTAISNQGKPLRRKTMTLYHIADDEMFFWDGRGNSLKDQFFEAFQNPLEMNFSFNKAIHLMKNDTDYQKLFKILNQKPTKDTMATAVIAYEKSISAPPLTQFDTWLAGDLKALNNAELAGFKIFNTKADCIACHNGYRFKDGLRNDIGLPDKDLGYGEISKKPDDFHMFKTPTLRGVAKRSPYMHDGSLGTLRDVIEHYNAPEFKRGNTDIPLEKNQGNVIAFHNFTQPLNLTKKEKKELIAFLKAL